MDKNNNNNNNNTTRKFKPTIMTKQQKKEEIESLARVKDKFEFPEVITKFQVKETEGRQGQGQIYLALELRKMLGWKKGDLLTVKLNKTKDGVEVRRLITTFFL